jgi:phospholipase/carboxylesterase
MQAKKLAFVHKFLPKSETGPDWTLLLLHGTGGDENDMIGLGQQIAPGAALLSPRGKVLENGLPRFFRRFSEGVFDEEDLKLRARELADFVREASSVYGFDRKNVVGVGYSNGANIAAVLHLLFPRVLKGSVLFRPMVPLVPDQLPDLSGVMVFVASGLLDPIVPKQESESWQPCSGKLEQMLLWNGRGRGMN